MLSSIRRALTPNPSHADDNDTSALTRDPLPPAQNFLIHHSSPPPFSSLEVSPETVPTLTNQALNGHDPVTAAQQFSPMHISPDHRSPDREQEGTGHDILGSSRVNDSTSKPYESSFALDGASDHHLQPPLEVAHAGGSPLPSLETTQTTGNHHRTRRTPTPDKNHLGVSSRASSPQKISESKSETPHPRRSPLPSTAPVQSTSEAQPTQQILTQEGIDAGIEPALGNNPESSRMANKKRRQRALHPTVSEPHPTMSEVPDVEPQQNAAANVDDATTSISPNAQPPKRRLEEDLANSESKSVKKQRNEPQKEEASSSTVKPRSTVEAKSSKERSRPKRNESSTVNNEQQDTIEDEAPKKRSTRKKEQGPTESVKQKDTPKDEMPKKRGRPKKDEGSTLSVKSQRVSKEDTPAKRGRPKREIAPPKPATEDPIEQTRVTTEIPKKRRRPANDAEAAQDAEPANVSAADIPKRRGRPKKITESTQVADIQVASTANTPRKKGRAKKNEVIARATEPQGPSNVETTKKRGRSKATGQSETAKKSTPAKRGRPKKE